MSIPILKGCQLFNSNIRPCERLEGKTPAEMAGIGTEDRNKWLGLITKSLESKRRSSSD